jgi:hypothetical protein
MWNSISKFNLSEEEINEVVNNLREDIENNRKEHCPDCGVAVNQAHGIYCDIARCLTCGMQKLGCDCEDGHGDIWTGTWPGAIECLEEGLICCWEDSKEWIVDMNAYYHHNT